MLTLSERCNAVIIAAYAKLPKKHLYDAITSVELADLGKHNGAFYSLSGKVELNYRLFEGNWPEDLPLIDDRGNFNPLTDRIVSRALHTTIHEFSHAIGEKTGLDSTSEWMSISGWIECPPEKHSELPPQFGRYIESRPGWEPGPSDWAFKKDSWFTREYGSKSPFEDFADCCVLKALGWETSFGFKHGLKKLHYLERMVWGEKRMTQSVLERHTGMILAASRIVNGRKEWTSRKNSLTNRLKSNGKTRKMSGVGSRYKG
jgi:hypothetical protein